jgi:hypothetical protein
MGVQLGPARNRASDGIPGPLLEGNPGSKGIQFTWTTFLLWESCCKKKFLDLPIEGSFSLQPDMIPEIPPCRPDETLAYISYNLSSCFTLG